MSDKKFYVSTSQLSAFYQCPARYAFTRRLRSLADQPWWITDGIAAHRIMAGLDPNPHMPSARALRLAQMAKDYINLRGYKILQTEVKQVVPLTRGIHLQRTIDAVARDSEGPALLDYKFVGKQWGSFRISGHKPALVAPKSAGFQSKCYLYSTNDPSSPRNWPSRIRFIVVSDDENKVRDFEYVSRPDDRKDVRNAASTMKHAWDRGWLPKNEGFLCKDYCEFRGPCFDEPDWQDLFEEVNNEPYGRDVRYRSNKNN